MTHTETTDTSRFVATAEDMTITPASEIRERAQEDTEKDSDSAEK